MDPFTAGLKMAMDQKFASTFATLQQNDPSVTNTFIFLFGGLTNIERAAATMAEALQANKVVKKVTLGMSAKWTRVEQWIPLLRVLQTSGREGGNVMMINLVDISEATEEERDPQRLMDTASSILQRVQGLATLKILSLSVPVSDDALKSFLETASPVLETLHFGPMDFEVPDISSFAATMRHRHSVKPFTLMLPCSSSSLKLLQSFSAETSPNLAFLMAEEPVDEDHVPQILDSISNIKSLDVLAFGNVKSQSVVHQLSTFLPKMKIKGLALHLQETERWTAILETKRNLVAALMGNFSLLKVDITAEGVIDFLDHSQHGKIAFGTERNTFLYRWVRRPQSVPKQLWPEAMRLASLSGHDQLFQSLLSIAPDLGVMRRRRKRKRRILFSQ